MVKQIRNSGLMKLFNYLYIHFHSVLFLVNLIRSFRGVSGGFKNLVNKFGNTDLFCKLAINMYAGIDIKTYKPIGGFAASMNLIGFFFH